MKPAIFLISVIIITIVLFGCGTADGPDIPSETVSAPAPTVTRTARPTPVITTSPEQTPAAAVSPEPELTPTPKPTEEKGKKVVAEGFWYMQLNDEIKSRITGMSYPAKGEDCKISYDDLRYIKLLHYDFEGKVKEGELIVNRKLAQEVTEIFYELYKEKYPLESVRLVDDFGQPGDDTLSMEANNTSAFCYRPVTGTKNLSRHSYGAAIDINPLYNPYMDGDRVAPENAAPYVDRSKDFPGKIDHDDLCYKLFKERGWSWGGDWKEKDWQHFSKDIGF